MRHKEIYEIKLGQIRFSIDFDQEEGIVEVTVHECKDLPPEPEDEEKPDPYFEIKLKPAAKKTYKTKVKKNKLRFKKIFDDQFIMSDFSFS